MKEAESSTHSTMNLSAELRLITIALKAGRALLVLKTTKPRNAVNSALNKFILFFLLVLRE